MNSFFLSHFSFAHSFIGCVGSYIKYIQRYKHTHTRSRDENTLWAIICNEKYEYSDVSRDEREIVA